MSNLGEQAMAILDELHTERLAYESEYVPLADAANLLTAYEETGMAPEEIKDMAELFHSYRHICGEMTPGRLRELVEADRDGRCVVLGAKNDEYETIRDLYKIVNWISGSVLKHDFSPFRIVAGAPENTFPVVVEYDRVIDKHSETIYLAFKDLEIREALKGGTEQQ